LVMSFATTLLNTGFSQSFVMMWMSAFVLSFAVAFPTALIVAPAAKWGARRLTQTAHYQSPR